MERFRAKLEGKALPVVLLTIFVDVLGVGILIPVLPQLIYTIFEPAGYSMNGSLVMLGWLTAIYPLMMFFSTPVLGQLSDRFGRKPIIAISLLGTAIGYVIFAIGIWEHNIALLFLGRALDGLTGGNVSVARAVIADVSPPKHRTRNFGLIGACFGMGFVMGPYIGARLAAPGVPVFGLFDTPHWFDAATPFWFAAILAAINMVSVLTLLPETHKHINKKLKLAWHKAFDNIRKAALRPGLRVIFGAEFLFWGGFTFFMTFFQVLLIEKLHFDQSNVGDFFAYVGICIAVSQIVIVPLAAKRFKQHQVLRVSLVANGVALLLLLYPHNATELILIAPVIAIFNGLTMAYTSTLVSFSASRKEQGEVLGIEASVQSLAQAIPAVISGYVATIGVSMPVIVGGIIMICGGILFNIFYRPSRHILHTESASTAEN